LSVAADPWLLSNESGVQDFFSSFQNSMDFDQSGGGSESVEIEIEFAEWTWVPDVQRFLGLAAGLDDRNLRRVRVRRGFVAAVYCESP